MKRTTKKIIVFVMVIVTMFGLMGANIIFFYRMSTETEIYFKQLPLHEVRRIAVDSKNNIYIGLSWFSAIQVYDENGQFLYGISFENTPKGTFYFYTDTNDNIHVFSEGRMIEYRFSHKGLEEQKSIEMKDIEALFDIYERTTKVEYTTDKGDLYKYNAFNKRIMLYDTDTDDLIQKIILNVPKWPWTFGAYFSFGFFGGFILSFLLIPKEKIMRWLDPSNSE